MVKRQGINPQRMRAIKRIQLSIKLRNPRLCSETRKISRARSTNAKQDSGGLKRTSVVDKYYDAPPIPSSI
jgi:hypothetical protein